MSTYFIYIILHMYYIYVCVFKVTEFVRIGKAAGKLSIPHFHLMDKENEAHSENRDVGLNSVGKLEENNEVGGCLLFIWSS